MCSAGSRWEHLDWPSFPHKLSHYNFNLTLIYELVFFQRTSDINPWIWGVSIFSNFKKLQTVQGDLLRLDLSKLPAVDVLIAGPDLGILGDGMKRTV